MKFKNYSWKIAIPLVAILALLGWQLLDRKEINELQQDLHLASADFQEAPTSSHSPTPSSKLMLLVDEKPLQPLSERVGLQLSFQEPQETTPYLRNVLLNPGLEAGLIDRVTLIVNQANARGFFDDGQYQFPDHYWSGASFDIRTGNSAGKEGKIKDSFNTAEGVTHYLSHSIPALSNGDLIILTKKSIASNAPNWWIPLSSQSLVKAVQQARPESKGWWSAAFTPTESQAAQLHFYLDLPKSAESQLSSENSIAKSASPTPWELKFWTKAEGKEANLEVALTSTSSTKPLFQQTLSPSSQWQQIAITIPLTETLPSSLQLGFSATTAGATVYLDDVQLGPVQLHETVTAWNPDFVDLLRELRPSWLRDWQGQLSDTFQNRIAESSGRQHYRFRTSEGTDTLHYSYSIPEFLELCSQVQASPWIVVPSMLSDPELKAFGQFLADNANVDHFAQIILEFGNEQGKQSLSSLPSQNALADRAFQLIKTSAGSHVNIRKVIPNPESESISLKQERDEPFAQQMLQGLLSGQSPQLVSCLGSFDCTASASSQQLSSHLSTVKMLNDSIEGSLHSISIPIAEKKPLLTMTAFRTQDSWSAALVSAESDPIEIALTFPNDERTLPTHAAFFEKSPENPKGTLTKKVLQVSGKTLHVQIPAHSFIVLTNDS